IGAEQGRTRRPHLTHNNHLLGTGRFAIAPTDDYEYRLGYLSGLIRGDGTLKTYDYSGRRGRRDVLYQFRLALIDLEALHRAKRYLTELDVEATEFQFMAARTGYQEVRAIRTSTRAKYERICELITLPQIPTLGWHKGFLAGIFDAEGSRADHVLRISN